MYEYTDDLDHYISPNYKIDRAGDNGVGITIHGRMTSIGSSSGFFNILFDVDGERERWIDMFREIADRLEAMTEVPKSEAQKLEMELLEYDFRKGLRKV